MTGRPTDIIAAMLDLLTLFAARCEDKHTLRKLIALADDRSRWTEARSLFGPPPFPWTVRVLGSGYSI
jgi:hypothetical protein